MIANKTHYATLNFPKNNSVLCLVTKNDFWLAQNGFKIYENRIFQCIFVIQKARQNWTENKTMTELTITIGVLLGKLLNFQKFIVAIFLKLFSLVHSEQSIWMSNFSDIFWRAQLDPIASRCVEWFGFWKFHKTFTSQIFEWFFAFEQCFSNKKFSEFFWTKPKCHC